METIFVDDGFKIKAMENMLLSGGTGILMLSPEDYKKYKSKIDVKTKESAAAKDSCQNAESESHV